MTLKVGLLENAIDFIHDAVERLLPDDPNPRDVKYAVLHLSSGIELLLKYPLMKQHWALIFSEKGINRAKEQDFRSGDFISVTYDECLDRLKGICGIEIKPKHKETLSALKKQYRNKLEHFQIEVRKEDAISRLVMAWDFILYFEQYIDWSSSDAAKQYFDDIKVKIVRHRQFVDQKNKDIKDEIDKAKSDGHFILRCPRCIQYAMPLIDDGDSDCHFCHGKFTASDRLSEFHPTDVFEVLSDYPLECPSCGHEAFYPFSDVSQNPQAGQDFLCVRCGEVFDERILSYCDHCGKPLVDPEGDSFRCDDCMDYVISKED